MERKSGMQEYAEGFLSVMKDDLDTRIWNRTTHGQETRWIGGVVYTRPT